MDSPISMRMQVGNVAFTVAGQDLIDVKKQKQEPKIDFDKHAPTELNPNLF